MVEQTQGVTTHYVVEHFEEEFSDWTFAEYIHMLLSLNKLHDAHDSAPNHKEVLVLTNFPFIAQLSRGELEEDELGTRRNTEKFLTIINKPCFSASVMVSERAF